MNARDKRLLAYLKADAATWVLIGPTRIAVVRRIEYGPVAMGHTDVTGPWAEQGHYWCCGYANRDGNGGGSGGYDTEAEAVAYAEQLTGVDAVQQGVLALEAELNA